MRALIFFDGHVGTSLVTWLLEMYPDDLGAVVAISESPILSQIRERGIPTFIYASEAALVDQLSSVPRCDLGFTLWWPKLLSPSTITIPVDGFINTHPSLLPHNRGKHYNFWAIVEQAPFGVSLHFIDPGVDRGDVVYQKAIPYDWEDTGETLYHRASDQMIQLFREVYPLLRAGLYQRYPQQLEQGSYHNARELESASQIDIDGSYQARQLINLLRARTFRGHPGCRFTDNGVVYEVRVEIKRVGDQMQSFPTSGEENR